MQAVPSLTFEVTQPADESQAAVVHSLSLAHVTASWTHLPSWPQESVVHMSSSLQSEFAVQPSG